jgi:hypothetical protein
MPELDPAVPMEGAPPVDPTLRAARPPVPGRPVRADVAAGKRLRPPIHLDDPTVALDRNASKGSHRTLEFGVPRPVVVTVGQRRRPRRRYRTWPWIAGLVLVLLVLGIVLLVMMLRGARVDGDVDLVGSAVHLAARTADWSAR